jgi:signal transduction histidine kinase
VPTTYADAAITQALVRVARESLINAAKHAGPCRAHVTVDAYDPDRLRLRIADDGGETAAPGERSGHGLRSLQRTVRKCGGELQVSVNSVGTTVTAVVPIGEPVT